MLALSHDQAVIWKGRTSFPGVATSIRTARTWLAERLTDQGIEPPDNIALVLCELATNAIKHTRSGAVGGQFAVRILIYTDRIRIEVRDGGSFENIRPLHPTAHAPLAEHGRGLLLVNAFSSSWGRLLNGRGMFAEVPR